MAFAQWERPQGEGSFESEHAALQEGLEFINPRMPLNLEEGRRFAQWVLDSNVRWQMFQSQHQAKANILNTLCKLEDKYQVRG